LDWLARQAADYIEWRQNEQELAEKHRLLDLTRDAVVICDLGHRVRYWNKGAEELYGFSAQEVVGAIMHDLLRSELPENPKTIDASLIKEGHWSGEVSSFTADGQRIVTSSRWVLDWKPDGTPNAILKSTKDITARKLLIDELNHRAKNILATIQWIASQSLKRTTTPAAFVSSFQGRIHTLARAHTLLSDAAWHQADLGAVLHDQLLMDAIEDPRIMTAGPVVSLPPQLALHVALMSHELGTNARKYGALSLPSGKLSVTWSVEHRGDSRLRLRWVEDIGGKPKMPAAAHWIWHNSHPVYCWAGECSFEKRGARH
jgi:PAS domain S-box-containing protein